MGVLNPNELAAAGGLVGPVPVFVAIGDSLTEYETSGGSYQSKGRLCQARSLLGGRFDFPVANNLGVSGKTSTQVLNEQLTPALAVSGASWLSVLAGTNDPGAGISKETTLANLTAIYDAAIAKGFTVLAQAIPPRSVWTPLTGSGITAARQHYYWVNQGIRDYFRRARRGTIYVADTDTANLNQASNVGDPLSGTTTDGIHQSDLGGELGGQAIYDVLNPVLPRLILPTRSQANVYDSANNPLGNRLASLGFNIGTGGTASTGTSGTVTTGMTSVRTSGSTLTATLSKRTRAAVNGVALGGEIQDIVLGGGTGGAASEQIAYVRDLSAGAASFAIGETLVLEAEIETTGLVNVQNVSLFIQDVSGVGTPSKYGLQKSGAASDRTRPANTRLIATPPITMTAGTARCRVVIDAACDGAGVAGTVSINWLNLRTARSTD